MLVTNITDTTKNTGLKVVGIGKYRILPGETVEVPDELAYVTVKGVVKPLPAISALCRTRQIRIEETRANVVKAEAPVVTKEEPVAENQDQEKAEDERKKSEAAAKRKAAREKAKAAKATQAAEEAAESKDGE